MPRYLYFKIKKKFNLKIMQKFTKTYENLRKFTQFTKVYDGCVMLRKFTPKKFS